MADKISKEKRSKIMSAIRSKNTKPELALRYALWAQGIRYRIHYGKERIDIAFPSKKVAVFGMDALNTATLQRAIKNTGFPNLKRTNKEQFKKMND